MKKNTLSALFVGILVLFDISLKGQNTKPPDNQPADTTLLTCPAPVIVGTAAPSVDTALVAAANMASFKTEIQGAVSKSLAQLSEEVFKRCVVIYNNSATKKRILLGPVDNLKKYSIPGRTSWISPEYSSGPVIRIHTKSYVFEKKLELRNAYVLCWDDAKACWILEHIDIASD
jgi:hypothetical protein